MKDKLRALYASPVGDAARLVQYLVRLLQDDRVPKSAKLKLLGSGLYAWVDTDLIPDGGGFIPGLGMVDDIILLVHGIKCLIAETDSAVAVELWPGDEASFARTMTVLAKVDDTLFGNVHRAFTALYDKITGKSTGDVSR
ncbi:MAG: hypothetical protein JXX14_16605 [Deltaproteobacteria bacterium]|nr:hypothetical protein [Deltaproteobacteria bacterium]